MKLTVLVLAVLAVVNGQDVATTASPSTGESFFRQAFKIPGRFAYAIGSTAGNTANNVLDAVGRTSEIGKNAVADISGTVQQGAATIYNGITDTGKNVNKGVSEAVQGFLPDSLKGIATGPESLVNTGFDIFKNFEDTKFNLINSGVNTAASLADRATQGVLSVGKTGVNIGVSGAEMARGVNDFVVDTAFDAINSVVSGFSGMFGGLLNMGSSVANAVGSAAGAVNSAAGAVGSASGAISNAASSMGSAMGNIAGTAANADVSS